MSTSYQRKIFDAPAFVRGSETSREAATSIQPHASRLQAVVLGFIRLCGESGATSEGRSVNRAAPSNRFGARQ